MQSNMMQVTVPDGLGPGDMFMVQAPDGQQMQVQVPPGVKSGMPIQVAMPAPQAIAVVTGVPTAIPTAMPTAMPQTVVVNSTGGVEPGTNNLPAGGFWSSQTFIGTTTMIAFVILLLFFWPACAAPFCCPCDQRTPHRAARSHPSRTAIFCSCPDARASMPMLTVIRCVCRTGDVYTVSGRSYTRSGVPVTTGDDCCGHPCGGPAY